MKDILVTGSAGFIGTQLTQQLEDCKGCDLRGGNDAADYDALMRQTKSPDVIVHLAAQLFPEDDHDIKVMRTVAQYAKDTGAHVVYTSSAAVYEPLSLYAVQKLYGEVIFGELGATILRLFNVYGRGGNGVVDKWKQEPNKPIIVHGNGEQTRDFVSVHDVVAAIQVGIETKYKGTVDIGTGIPIRIIDVANTVNGAGVEFVKHPVGIRHSVARVDPDFPWRPQQESILTYFYENRTTR